MISGADRLTLSLELWPKENHELSRTPCSWETYKGFLKAAWRSLRVSSISTSTNSWAFQTVRLILGKSNLKGRILTTIPLSCVSKCQEQVGFLESHPLCRPDYLPDSVSCLFEYNTDSWKNTDSLLWVNAGGALATSGQGVSSSKRMTERNPINSGKRHSSRRHRAEVRAVLSVARKWRWETDWVSQSFTTRTQRCLIWAGGGSQPLDSKTQLQTHSSGCRQVVLTFFFLKPFSLVRTEHTQWDPEYVQTLTVPSRVWRKQSEFLAPSHILCKSLSLLSGTTFLVAFLFTPEPATLPSPSYLDFK